MCVHMQVCVSASVCVYVCVCCVSVCTQRLRQQHQKWVGLELPAPPHHVSLTLVYITIHDNLNLQCTPL